MAQCCEVVPGCSRVCLLPAPVMVRLCQRAGGLFSQPKPHKYIRCAREWRSYPYKLCHLLDLAAVAGMWRVKEAGVSPGKTHVNHEADLAFVP